MSSSSAPPRFLAALALALATLLEAHPAGAVAFSEAASAYGLGTGVGMSWGASFVDFDGDGDTDLYIGNHWPAPASLYRNDGAAPLTDHSAHFQPPPDRHDQLWSDLNGDGIPDHYLIHGGTQPSELFWNQGDGTFVEGAQAANAHDSVGVSLYGRGREVTMADFDLDDHLDLYIVNAWRTGYGDPSVFLWNDGDGTFTRDQYFPIDLARPYLSGADFDLDGFTDIVTTNPFDNDGDLLRNNGNRTFTSVISTAFPGITQPLRRARGLTWGDYDNDGDLDLLAAGGDGGLWDFASLQADSLKFYMVVVAADLEQLTLTTTADSVTVLGQEQSTAFARVYNGSGGLWTTSLPVTLSVAEIAGVPPGIAQGLRGMFVWSVAGATVDTVHVAVGGSATQSINVGGWVRPIGGSLLSLSTTGFDAPPPQATGDLSLRLYRNEANGTFSEATSAALTFNDSTANSYGAAWADYDNDGWIDFYVANGGTIETGNQTNHLYRNNGDGTFSQVAATEQVQGTSGGVSGGAAWGDLSGDGFLELFVGNGREFPPFGLGTRELFVNSSNGNHWMMLQLRSVTGNGSGIGAHVRFVGPSGTRWRWLRGDGDSAYQNFLGLHVGLGADAVCDTVEIHWPNGGSDTYLAVAADTQYLAVEGDVSLRAFGAPSLTLSEVEVADTLGVGRVAAYPVLLQATSAEAVPFTASGEDSNGTPVSWLSMTPATSVAWPVTRDVSASIVVDTSGLPAGLHVGRLVVASSDVAGDDVVEVRILVDPAVGTPIAAGIGELHLGRPRPNPTASGAHLSLTLPSPAFTEVSVHDVQGRRVRTLRAEALASGVHPIVWNGRDESGSRVASGIYMIRAFAEGRQLTRMVVVVN